MPFSIYKSPLTGRFFRSESDLSLDQKMYERCIAAAHSMDDAASVSLYRGLCTSVSNTGFLDEESEALFYELGSDVWCFCVREDRRTAPRSAVMAEARQQNPSSNTPVEMLSVKQKKVLMECARQSVLESAVPSSVILTGIVRGSSVWISRKSSMDDSVRNFLSSFLGPLVYDSVIWEQGLSFAETSSLLVERVVSGGPSLSSEVRVSRMSVEAPIGSLTVDDPSSMQDLLGRFCASSEDSVSVREMGFELLPRAVSFDVDSHGVSRACPRPSRGGLPRNRLVRRLNDCERAFSSVYRALSSLGD